MVWAAPYEWQYYIFRRMEEEDEGKKRKRKKRSVKGKGGRSV